MTRSVGRCVVELPDAGTLRAALELLARAERRKSRDRPYHGRCRAALAALQPALLGLFRRGNPLEQESPDVRLITMAGNRRVLRAILDSPGSMAAVCEAAGEVLAHCERWSGVEFTRRRLASREDFAELAKLHKLLNTGEADSRPDKFAREIAKWA